MKVEDPEKYAENLVRGDSYRKRRMREDPTFVGRRQEYNREWRLNRIKDDPNYLREVYERRRIARLSESPERTEYWKEWRARWQREHQERLPAYYKRWHDKKSVEDPKYMQDRRERDRQRMCKTRLDPDKAEHYRVLSRTWRKANPERARETVCRWGHRHPDRVRFFGENRRARKRNAEGGFTQDDISEIMSKQEGKCIYCQTDLLSTYHIDHILPLSKGGSNYPDNLQLLCAFCNLSKHDRNHDEFVQYRQTISIEA